MSLKKARELIIKKHGKETILSYNDLAQLPRIESGSLFLDDIFGGGVPEGRVIQLFGPECVAGDTGVMIQRVLKDGSHSDPDYYTMNELYEDFSNDEEASAYYSESVDESHTVVSNRVVNVVKSGVKHCFKVKTSSGFDVTATADHMFLSLRQDENDRHGYRKLGDMRVGDVVFVADLTRKCLPTTITHIIDVGDMETYDIAMESPLNNYIADGIVVHNSGGKSAIALFLCGSAIAHGHSIVYIDAENAFDPVYAKNTFGVDISDEEHVIFSQEENAAIVYDIVQTCCEQGAKIIVIDSLDALMTDAEFEGEFGDAHVGQMARMNSLSLKKIVSVLNAYKAILVYVSQLRMKIGVPKGTNPETTSGGNSPRFYASIRARVSKMEFLTEGEVVIGQKIRVKVVKNKTAPPFRECELYLYYNKGFDVLNELVDVAVRFEIVRKSGAWYYYKDLKFQGLAKFLEYLRAEPEVLASIRGLALEQLKASPSKPGVPESEDTESAEPEPVTTFNVAANAEAVAEAEPVVEGDAGADEAEATTKPKRRAK